MLSSEGVTSDPERCSLAPFSIIVPYYMRVTNYPRTTRPRVGTNEPDTLAMPCQIRRIRENAPWDRLSRILRISRGDSWTKDDRIGEAGWNARQPHSDRPWPWNLTQLWSNQDRAWPIAAGVTPTSFATSSFPYPGARPPSREVRRLE